MGIRKKLKYLDPFTYVDMYVAPRMNPSGNETVNWIIYIIFAFFFAFIIYSAFGLLAGTSSPMIIVLSESMEPVFYRGDVMIIQGAAPEYIRAQEVDLTDRKLSGFYLESFADLQYTTDLQFGIMLESITFPNNQTVFPDTEGDTVVYISDITGEQVIHRVTAKINAKDGVYLITKGDNQTTNTTVDQDCGKVTINTIEKACITRYPIKADEILGKTIFKIPLIGYAKLLIFDDLPNLIFGCPEGKTCYFP